MSEERSDGSSSTKAALRDEATPCDDAAVTMVLGEGEPTAGPWRVERLTQFAQLLVNRDGASLGRPATVALDGHRHLGAHRGPAESGPPATRVALSCRGTGSARVDSLRVVAAG